MIDGEKVLVNRHSAFQPILLTQDSQGFLVLRFGRGEARQSVVKPGDPTHLELPYARVLPSCFAFAPDPRRLLILGLGAGSLPRFFHHHFPQISLDVVELDAEVVQVAKEFCGFAEGGRMNVHVQDGRDFVESRQAPYDVIILDCFGSDAIPAHLATFEFLTRVREALAPRGIVAANIWGPASNPLYGHMLMTYRAAFEEFYVLDVPGPGTKIFIGLRVPQPMSRQELVAAAREISRERGFAYDLGDAIAGFRKAERETAREGHLLRD